MQRQKLNKIKFFTLCLCLIIICGITYSLIKIVQANQSVEVDDSYPAIEVENMVAPLYSIEMPRTHIKHIDHILDEYRQEWIEETNKKTFKGKIEVSYKILHLSKQTISLELKKKTIDSKENVASDIQILTFDLLLKKQIKLTDLFKNGDYLATLSNIASSHLLDHRESTMDENAIKEHTKPKTDHFEQFALYENAIVFYIKTNTSSPLKKVAISKTLLKDWLHEKYMDEVQNRDVCGHAGPQNPITEMPVIVQPLPLDKKIIALTFDDGPKKGVTDRILAALQEYDGHATFFVLGNRVENQASLIKRISEEGHEIGNHSYSHPYLPKLPIEQIMKEINLTQQAVKHITGKEPVLLRPPYGAINGKVRQCMGNMQIALWDVDTIDWKTRNTKQIVHEVMTNAGDGKVVLMHDIYNTSADAAVTVIRELGQQGYKFVTMSDLMKIQRLRLENQN